MSKLTVTDAQAYCLRENIPFYSYRLPGKQERWFGMQTEGEVEKFHGVQANGGRVGFVVVPFRETEETPSLFIRGDFAFVDTADEQAFGCAVQGKGRQEEERRRPASSVGRGEYHHQVAAMISALKQGVVRKMVLSRGMVVDCDGSRNAPLWFEKLAENHPHAFVFLVCVPGIMTWMGATPEIFLRQSPDGTDTMALAGTRPAGEVKPWGEKEMEEQAIVSEYIAGLLRETGDWKVNGPFSREAGKAEHLCTTFSHAGMLSPQMLDAIRKALHPTPAVGGFPAREAIELLERIEGRGRRYYAGYLGPVRSDCTLDWFVNLRSMEVFPDAVRLYVGGGITALSDPDDEWNETELKSGTLLDVVQAQ